jgi:predicted Rossmann-fold nucleotide-binding protein
MSERLSVAIFGSANVTGPAEYQAQIEALGGELATKDIDIFVGSTTGLIGRFLQGVHKAQKVSHVKLVAYGDQRYMSINDIDELILKDCYFSRLSFLCECEVFIVLDGQLGTMAETMVTWNRLQANKEFNRKIIIFGDVESTKIKFLLDNFIFSK